MPPKTSVILNKLSNNNQISENIKVTLNKLNDSSI